MEQDVRNVSLVDQAKAMWGRRKWLAVATAVGVTAAALSLVLSLPNLYESTVTVLVDRHQVPESLVKASVQGELEPRLHMVSQDILSRARLLALIERFSLYPQMRATHSEREVIDRMRSDVQIQLKSVERKGSDAATTVAFSVSYRGPHPQTVSDVTNTLSSFYIEENRKNRERQAAATAALLKSQLIDTKKRLEVQEKRLSEFRSRYPGALPQQAMGNLLTLERLHSDLRQNAENQHRVVERRQILEQQPGFGGTGGGVGVADPEMAQLAKLKQELVQLRAQYSEKYPDVARTKAEVATLERQIAARGRLPDAPAPPPDTRASGAVALADTELRRLRSEEQRLRETIASYQRRVDETPLREAEFQDLGRDHDTTRELYKSLLARYEEATIGETMEQRRTGEVFRVVDPAVPAEQPVAPKRLVLIAVGLMLAFGLAGAVIVAAEQLDTSFHSVDGLRAFTSVPVAVAVPRIVTEDDHRQYRRRARLATVGALLGLTVIVGATWYVGHGNADLVSALARKAT